MCACVNKEEETSGGSVSAKVMKQDLIAIFARVHESLCNHLPNTSVTLYIKVPFLLFFSFAKFYTSSLIVRLAFSLLCLLDTFLHLLNCAHIFRWLFFRQLFLTLYILFSNRWICPIQAGSARALWPTAQRVWECYYLITRHPPLPCLWTRAAYLRRVPPQHVPTAIMAATITTTTTTAIAITAVQRSQILFQSSWNPSLIQ